MLLTANGGHFTINALSSLNYGFLSFLSFIGSSSIEGEHTALLEPYPILRKFLFNNYLSNKLEVRIKLKIFVVSM